MSARRSKARGYTMVEAMTALGVLGLGAYGIVGIQRTTLLGNINARNLATANAIAVTWAERLRNDGLLWNQPNGVDDLSDTYWLSQALPNPGGWIAPATVVSLNASSAADVMGADIVPPPASLPIPGSPQPIEPAFCTHVRLTKFYPTEIRAEIRVYWSRTGNPILCNEAPANTDAKWGNTYGFVVMTTAISRNSAVN
jgi:type IV pilus assembly protein PilV